MVVIYLQDWRVRQGLTLKQAGEAVGRHLASIQKWERGGTSPTLREIELLAQAYGIHPAAFFFHPDGLGAEAGTDSEQMRAKIVATEPAAFWAKRNPSRAKELSDCLFVLEHVPATFVFHWLEMAKTLIVDQTQCYLRPKTAAFRRIRKRG